MDSNKENLENVYINKIQNIVGIALHGLFENIVYLYENKKSFDDRKELDNLVAKYLKILDYSTNSTNEETDELILSCVLDKKKYKEKALEGLYNSYNLDFITDEGQLIEKSNDILDEQNIITFTEHVSKEYLTSLIDEELENVDSYDNFSLSNLCALTALFNKNVFEQIISDNISVLPPEIVNTFLNNSKIKIHAITKSFKQKEFKNAPLTVFDFYSTLFITQNQMIVLLTFFDEIKKTFSEDILTKDNFFTLKKVLTENDDSFLESIVERNEERLDQLIDENDSLNYEIQSLNEASEEFKSNYLHKYVDFLEEILFEDIHYFMQSIENVAMGIKVADEVLSTIDNVADFTDDNEQSFSDYFEFLYKKEKKLTFSQKLIFYKTVFSLIISQLIYLDKLKSGVIVSTDSLVSAIKDSYNYTSFEDIKLLTAYIIE